jgi:hypothetical protein
MLSKTEVTLAVVIALSTVSAASAATKHHHVSHVDRPIYNYVHRPIYNIVPKTGGCTPSGGPECSGACLPSGPPCAPIDGW